VLVDDATRRLAQAGIAFDDAGAHELKGKSEPQHLWRALRVLSGVGGVQRVDGLEAPLTGRDVELRLIKDLFHATIDRRQARMVVVSGAAGVGKSRLGWEFEKYVDGVAALTRWHRGRCLSYGDGVAFWALAEIVRQRLGIADEDPVEEASAKLAAGLETYLASPEERAYVGLRLARLLGLPFAGDTGKDMAREELFAGWRLWFERIAAETPVILLIEDLHYADAGLLEFLDHLVDWARDVPIFVLVFARPELEASRPGWGVGRNRTLLALDPLDSASMLQMLDALVPGMSSDATNAIASHAQGIPLFAVETVRSLIDRDIVVPRDGVYRLVGDVGALTVPDSLHGLLAARLDALEPAVRGLVADAAVLGSSFPADALIAISSLGADGVRSALDELVRREVLTISADPLSPQRGTYRFAHEMLRQVAYDTLSRRDRKSRHLAVAAHLRATFPGDGEEVVEVVAQHFLDALAAVPEDGDAEEIRDAAVEALIRAGDRAERTGAPGRARASFAAAAELLDSSARTDAALTAAGLRERAAQAAIRVADFALAFDYAERARAVHVAAGDLRSVARLDVLAGQTLRHWGRHHEARDRLVPAIDVLREEPDVSTVLALQQLGSLEALAGTPQAGPVTEETLVMSAAIGVPPQVFAGSLTGRGIWLSQSGRSVEASALMREAARLAELAGEGLQHGLALMNLSDTLGATSPAESLECARQAATILRRAGVRRHLAIALLNLASASIAIGDWDAVDHVLTTTAEDDGLGDDENILGFRALFAALRGDVDTADRLLTNVPELRANESPQEQAMVAVTEEFTAHARGSSVDTLHCAQRALQHVDALGISGEQPRWAWPLAARAAYELDDRATTDLLLAMIDECQPGHVAPMLQAERLLVLARRAAADHDPGAADAFAEAVGSLRRQGTPYHLGHGLVDYAAYVDGTDSARADALLDEAQLIAEQLKCQPIERRVKALRPAPVTSAT
jgi:tetratricopeptide (TPR) repeat protein